MEIQIKKSFSKDIDKIHDKNILKSIFEIKLFFFVRFLHRKEIYRYFP